MNVLVTGGVGFIGRRLVKTLVLAGCRVRVLDYLSEQIHGSSATTPPGLAGTEFVHGDVRDADCLASALVGVDAVVHLAAETGVGQSMYEIERYVDANDRGTACLVQALVRAQRPGRVVLASSRAVYGEGSTGVSDAVRRARHHVMESRYAVERGIRSRRSLEDRRGAGSGILRN